jgi:hypothetical protein
MSNRRQLTFSPQRQERDRASTFRKQLDEIIRGMRRKRRSSLNGDDRPVGARTADTRTDELFRMFDVLRLELGFKIESPHGLKEKHAQALVDHWVKSDYAISTIENRLSFLRVFAELGLEKRGMIAPLDKYLPGVKRSRVAKVDKSVTAVADPETVLSKAMALCPHVGTQFWVQWAFGLRPQEAICLRPIQNDLGDYLAVLEGTKGGRPRQRLIEHDFQRAALKAGKMLAAGNRRGLISQPGLTLAQAKRRFYYIAEKIGLTRNGLIGATPHGLRHDSLQWEFKHDTGVDAPVKAVDPDAAPGKSILDLSKEELDRAQYRISNLAGHNRKSSASAYLGSVPAARRKAMASEPLPPTDPQKSTGTLNQRMAAMAREAAVRDLALQHLGGKNTRDGSPTAASAEGMPTPAARVVAPDLPAVKESPASAASPATSRAAQPQRPARNISAAPAREAKPAKPGLAARLFGKKNPGEQVTLPHQDDLFSAPPPAAPDPSSGKDGPDERDPYAKPEDWG